MELDELGAIASRIILAVGFPALIETGCIRATAQVEKWRPPPKDHNDVGALFTVPRNS
jgi:hypothetical protein